METKNENHTTGGLWKTVKKPLRIAWKSTARVRHQACLRWNYRLHRDENKRPLFLLARQRTGGNMVLDYLRSIPDVSMAHEFLNPVFHYGFRPRKNSNESLLLHVRRSVNQLPGTYCGCKILIGQFPVHQISLTEFDEGLRQPRYLLLYRRDILKQFVSLKIAHQTKQYLAQSSEKIRTTDVIVDLDELEDLYRLNAAEYRSVLDIPSVNERCLTFAYEDVIAKPQKLFDRELFPFLETNASPVSTQLVKQNKRPIEETVTNYSDIEDRLDKYRTFNPVLSST
jgi:hypothetical protein